MSLNCGENLTFASAAVANIIAKDLSVDEITLLSAFLMAVADNLAIIAVTRDKKE